MKLTKSKLKQIIKEELENILENVQLDYARLIEVTKELASTKPFPGMPAELSKQVFLSQIQAHIHGPMPTNEEELRNLYDKLYRIFDPSDTSHLNFPEQTHALGATGAEEKPYPDIEEKY